MQTKSARYNYANYKCVRPRHRHRRRHNHTIMNIIIQLLSSLYRATMASYLSIGTRRLLLFHYYHYYNIISSLRKFSETISPKQKQNISQEICPIAMLNIYVYIFNRADRETWAVKCLRKKERGRLNGKQKHAILCLSHGMLISVSSITLFFAPIWLLFGQKLRWNNHDNNNNNLI